MRTLLCLALLACATDPLDEELDEAHVTTGFVARWTFDAGGADETANGNALTLANGAAVSAGALVLDGVDDHAVRAAPSSVLRPSRFAISAWVKLTATDTSGADVVSLGDNYGLRIAADGNVKSWIWDPVTYRMATTLGVNVKDGAWHHLVGQYDGTRVQIFVDGTLRRELAAAGPLTFSRGTSLLVGKHGHGGSAHDFRGSIDDVRIYDRALTAADIASLARTTVPLKVLTWNTGGPLGATAIQLVTDQQPNVVFLQEVDSPTLVENLRVKLQATYGGTWHKHVISRGTDTTGSYVAIVSQYPLSNIQSLVLRTPGTYVLPCFSSSAVFWAGRAALGANIIVGSRRLAIFATRMTSEGDRGCARVEENAKFKDWANTMFTGTRIYGGDFNMQPYSNEPEYQLMLNAPYPTTDSWAQAVGADTAIAYNGSPTLQTPTRNTRMDYVFFDQNGAGLSVREAEILDEGSLSDHRMMITTFDVD